MSIGFNPQNPAVKKSGREELADMVGLSTKQLKPYFKKAEAGSFLAHYNRFVDAHPQEAKLISQLRTDGVGPGELVAWFVFDDLQLGGKNCSIDLLVDGQPFAEMKGGSYDLKNHAVKDFKITKDSDPAVDLLHKDLDQFNETYRKITGSSLIGWEPGNIKTTTLELWESIDLKKVAKTFAGPPRTRIPVELDVNGMIYQPDGTELVHYMGNANLHLELQKFMTSDVQVAVNNHTSTLKKIVGRWRQMAFNNYLAGKRFALVNTASMKMEFFGELSVNMIGLLRVARNQPSARIYLPKEKK